MARKPKVLTVFFFLFLMFCKFSGEQDANATGGAFTNTKHGGKTTDGAIPYDVGNGPGVDRTVNPDYNFYYNDSPPYGGVEGAYVAGECTQCHEPHGSFGGGETEPVDGSPDQYLLMRYAPTVSNYAELCWYCHENFFNINSQGSPLGYGKYGFYQGKAIYEWSSHYDPPAGFFYWPGTSGDPVDIWPRQTRTSVDSANDGSCLNCHTPHGIQETTGNEFDTAAVPAGLACPDGTGTNLHCADNNASVSVDNLIPRQLIAWEEALCENCHDPSGPSTKDIQSEIDKRSFSPSLIARSGHPVDDTSLAGKHVVSEAIPVTVKHVECYDCHNPHVDLASNRLEGMKYIDIDGVSWDPAQGDRQPYVYEVCFKCHSSTHATIIPNKTAGPSSPEWLAFATGTTRSTVDQSFTFGWCGSSINPASTCTDGSDKRIEFDPSTAANKDVTIPDTFSNNRAYHPVAAAGRNTSVVLNNQLLGNLTNTSTIQCTDCHNNEKTGAGTVIAGVDADHDYFTPTYPGPVTQSNLRFTDIDNGYSFTDPVGPHGSTNVRILRANYNTDLGTTSAAPFSSWDPTNFQLCFNCHNSQVFTDDDGLIGGNRVTNFKLTSNQSGFSVCYAGSGPVKINLHALHLANETPNAGWHIINNMYTSCANCHYNVHSNAEQTNTILDPGADLNTHLVNFSPQVQARNFVRPRWFSLASGVTPGGLPCDEGNVLCGLLGMSCPCDIECISYGGGITGSMVCNMAQCGCAGCPCNCPCEPTGGEDLQCDLTCHGGGMDVVPNMGATAVDAVYNGYID